MAEKSNHESLQTPDTMAEDLHKAQNTARIRAAVGAGVEAGRYSDDPKQAKAQRKEGEADIHRDYARERGKVAGKGKTLGAKASGKAIAAAASIPLVGAPILYGLAFLNDFPDLAEPLLSLSTAFIWDVFVFLFDVVVFLGFRYFIRQHINIPGVKKIFYSSALLEAIPWIGSLPFWMIMTYFVRKSIKEHEDKQALEQQMAQMQAEEPAWMAGMQAQEA